MWWASEHDSASHIRACLTGIEMSSQPINKVLRSSRLHRSLATDYTQASVLIGLFARSLRQERCRNVRPSVPSVSSHDFKTTEQLLLRLHMAFPGSGVTLKPPMNQRRSVTPAIALLIFRGVESGPFDTRVDCVQKSQRYGSIETPHEVSLPTTVAAKRTNCLYRRLAGPCHDRSIATADEECPLRDGSVIAAFCQLCGLNWLLSVLGP